MVVSVRLPLAEDSLAKLVLLDTSAMTIRRTATTASASVSRLARAAEARLEGFARSRWPALISLMTVVIQARELRTVPSTAHHHSKHQ